MRRCISYCPDIYCGTKLLSVNCNYPFLSCYFISHDWRHERSFYLSPNLSCRVVMSDQMTNLTPQSPVPRLLSSRIPSFLISSPSSHSTDGCIRNLSQKQLVKIRALVPAHVLVLCSQLTIGQSLLHSPKRCVHFKLTSVQLDVLFHRMK